MFILVLFYVTFYLMLIEKYKASFISFIPAFLLYFLVAGFQYGVGTDYFTYVTIYESEWYHNFFLQKKEIFFYFILKTLNFFNLPPQSLFLTFSFLQAVGIFYYLKIIKKKQFTIWLFFLAFFCVTNIYNNQLNGIRQYLVICFLPLMTIILYEKKYIRFIAIILISSLIHSSAIVLLILIPIRMRLKFLTKHNLKIFLSMPIFYLVLAGFVEIFVNLIFPQYGYYFRIKEYSEGENLLTFLTKLYYLPLIFYFYKVYKIDNSNISYLDFMIVLFSIFYSFFILGIDIAITVRVFYYLIFFYTFPIYYLLNKTYKENKVFEFIFTILYILVPYILKVTIFATREFSYASILFN